MNTQDLNPMDLEPEFGRIGTTFYEAFRRLCNLNTPDEPIQPGEPFNIEVDFQRTLHVLRSMPDGAGVEAFLEAMKGPTGGPPPRTSPGA